MRHLCRLALMLALYWATGCCYSGAPRADRYFDRESAWSTIKGFTYAVEAGQWDFAYDCLTPESREQFSRLKMIATIRFGSHPETDTPLREAIVGHDLSRSWLAPLQSGVYVYSLIFEEEGESGDILGIDIYLRRRVLRPRGGDEGGEPRWEIDLVTTVRALRPPA